MPNMKVAQIGDFSGGLDLISALSDIAPDATPDSLNFRISQYGGIEKVLGYSAFATAGANIHDGIYFSRRDGSYKKLIVATPTAWQSIDASGVVANIRTGLTSVTDTTFAVYEDKLYGLDASNNLASWDGTTLTAYAPGVNSGPNKGIILGIWQNQMWVCPSGLRIEFSAAGILTGANSWPSTNYVELGGAGSTDSIVAGYPTAAGLVVFTKTAAYLVYDAASGANQLIDSQHGLSSRRSLAMLNGELYGMSPNVGIVATNGSAAMSAFTSRMISPLFNSENPVLTAAAGVAWQNSYFCSYQRQAATYNNLTLEASPLMAKWIKHIGFGPPPFMAFEYPASLWISSDMEGSQNLYFVDASNPTRVRKAFTTGSFMDPVDESAKAITAYWDLAPNSMGAESQLKRLHKVRLVGRGGSVQVGLKLDYQSTIHSLLSAGIQNTTGGSWGTAVWGAVVWGEYFLSEGWARVVGRGRRLSLRIQESSTATSPMRDNIGGTSGQLLGGCGVYLVEPHFTVSSRMR